MPHLKMEMRLLNARHVLSPAHAGPVT